jgi:predicted Zn finger-like uncharacterized protein
MKIVCDACQAKYSISDDKVQGKVFKIRCKKCSNIIVVRGGAGASEPAPAPAQEKDTRVYDYGYEGGDHAPAGDESVWHVVINQDQVGPMTAVEVQQRFASGEIDSETYIWREGFSDWLPLSQVDTFAALAASGGAAPRSAGGDAVASMFGGGEDAAPGRSDPGDLFAAAGSNARHDDDGGDLFGNKPASSPSNQASSKLRGERNENSVLFSLNNLAQLASDKPVAAASHSAPTSSGSATGGAGGEGSGLIDIRSMASAYLGGPGGGPSKPVSAGVGSIDDLPVFGGGGFSEPAVIVPMSARPSSNKLVYALIGSVGVLAVAAVIVVVVLLKGGDKSAQVAATRADTSEKPLDPRPAVPTPPPSDGKPATPPPPTQVAATEPPPDKRPTTAPTHKTTPPPSASPSSPPSTPKPPKQAVEKPAPTPKADPPAAKADAGGCDEISCVLNNNEGPCCAKFAKRGGKAGGGGGAAAKSGGGGGDLPDSLDRAMITDGIGKVRARVMSCGDKSPAKGQVKVSVKVGPDGRVTNVTVKNTPDDALGACVSGMVQKATFPKTQTGGQFAYPYTF